MVPVRTEIRKTEEKANVIEDNISKHKHSLSPAPAVKNFGHREYPSISLILESLNLGSWSKLPMVVDPEMVSAKCCINGALHMPTNHASSRAEGI